MTCAVVCKMEVLDIDVGLRLCCATPNEMPRRQRLRLLSMGGTWSP